MLEIGPLAVFTDNLPYSDITEMGYGALCSVSVIPVFRELTVFTLFSTGIEPALVYAHCAKYGRRVANRITMSRPL